MATHADPSQAAIEAADDPQFVSARVRSHAIILVAVTALGVFFSLFHIYTAYRGVFPDLQQRGTHLGIILALVFLVVPAKRTQSAANSVPLYDLLLAAISLFSGLYLTFNYIGISHRFGFPTTFEIALGCATIIVLLEAVRRTIGMTLVVISVLFIAYMWFGRYMPMEWGGHVGISFRRSVSVLYLSQDGILGPTLGASATYIALFVIFGAVVRATGTGQFIIDLAHAALGVVRGGPAKVAVVASAGLGMISGSATANAASTGIFTIPLMKRLGYKPTFAAGVEAAASTGGQLLPPVMGAAAFIMVEYLQIPYREIAFAAFIPAALFYLMVLVTVDLEAARLGLEGLPRDQLPRTWPVLTRGIHLLLGPIVLVYCLAIMQTTPLFAAFAGLIAAFAAGWLRPHSRVWPVELIAVLREGALGCMQVAVACAAAGLIIGPVFLTGLGPRLAEILVVLADGNLFVLLVFAMITGIVLSMGLPSTAVYILVAVLIAPAIVALGVVPLAAHLFAYWFGTMSNITPPVATAAFASAAIAKSNPMLTAVEACRLGMAGFILPFMFVYGPSLLLYGSALEILLATITAAIGVCALAVSLQGYFLGPARWYERALFALGALITIHPHYISDIGGFLVLGLAGAIHYARVRQKV